MARRLYQKARSYFREAWERVFPCKVEDYVGVNIEGFLNYNFTIRSLNKHQGVSAMLRVKNEGEKIIFCLNSIINLFDEIVLIDNHSTDKTVEKVRVFKQTRDPKDKIKLFAYPFQVARCGSENKKTPESSVSSLAYYYNWALSHCSYRYVCKWDGDMILKLESEAAFKAFLEDIQHKRPQCWYLYGQTVYRDERGDFFLSKEEINKEIMLFPYGSRTRYHKIDLYEYLKSIPELPRKIFDEIVFYELKFVDEDEFSHWSSFEFPSGRKQLEWQNFQAVRTGMIDPDRFERITFEEIARPVTMGEACKTCGT